MIFNVTHEWGETESTLSVLHTANQLTQFTYHNFPKKLRYCLRLVSEGLLGAKA